MNAAPGIIVADCDALNFVLVHLALLNEIESFLARNNLRILTLDEVYRHEAQFELRTVLDQLKARNLHERVRHASHRDLDKKQNKNLSSLYRHADKRHRLASDNDRGLLFEAEDRSACLVTEDVPLRQLARDRNREPLDVLDVVSAIHGAQIVSATRRSEIIEKWSRARQESVEHYNALLETRGGVERFSCVSSSAQPSETAASQR